MILWKDFKYSSLVYLNHMELLHNIVAIICILISLKLLLEK